MPLSEAEVIEFLTDVKGLDAERASLVARLSAGSIGRALGFTGQDAQAGPLETARNRARALLEAALLPSPVERYAAALAQPPAGARGEYATTLDFLVLWLRDLAAATSGAKDAIVNLDATTWLGECARTLPRPDAALDAIALTEDALRLTQFNINPQLGLIHLLHELNRTLVAPGELAGASRRP
jgi:hypothetical protein